MHFSPFPPFSASHFFEVDKSHVLGLLHLEKKFLPFSEELEQRQDKNDYILTKVFSKLEFLLTEWNRSYIVLALKHYIEKNSV